MATDATYIQKNAMPNPGDKLNSKIVSLLEKFRILAIGELHGNNQTPLIAARIAEALTDTHDVVLGLEIEQQNQYGLNEYLRTGDKKVLRLLGHFAREYQDGRSSVAMVELLERVRQNSRIQVIAFDPDFSNDEQDRDTKMAQHIIEVVAAHPLKKLVLLAGNIHSATKIGSPFDPKFRPMAYQLSALPQSPIKSSEVLSIITRHENASLWVCANDNSADCGPKDLNRNHSAYVTAVPFDSYFLMEPKLSPEGYLATWFTRTVKVSPPFRQVQ